MFLLLHVPMMKNIYSRCDRTPATIGYKLIVFLAIVDEIQLVTHLYASIMMIFNLRTPVAPVLILGAFIDGAWFTTITLTFTITVFRFIVVAVDFLKYYFVTNIAFFVMTGINLCVFLAFFSLNISGLSREIFDFSEFGWWYAENCELSDFMMTIDLWGCSIFYCSSAVIYVLIFVYIFAKRKKNRNNQDIRSALQVRD
ncbi:unnamed protein product, partial [Mesorhabditis belari]|uniref:Uncharacterized protein n=1 Tax=Mesorhabditis belari TaxID=2138241 RepID=A0AAF3J7I2_9BILA